MSQLDSALLGVGGRPHTGDEDSSRRAIRESLRAVRSLLHLEVAFVSRFAENRRFFDFVDTDLVAAPVRVGDSDPLEETYCARVVDGRLAGLIPDARKVPEVQDLPVTHRLPVGAHVSVPIVWNDGPAMGTLCCFSRTPEPLLRQRDLELLTVVSRIIGRHMDFLVTSDRRRRERLDRVSAVLEAGGPAMALQPIVEISTGRVAGFEALSRFPATVDWAPDEWFSEAARIGLGDELQASAVQAALRLVPRLPTGTTLSVNVSARALCSAEQIVELVTGSSAGRLVVEVTEHEQVDDYAELLRVLRRVRRAGARVAVDDAGSGYAGFEHILQIQPEVLKLDRTLVQGVAHHPGRQAMCSALLDFGRRMRTQLVAEGVETEEDLSELASAGVPLVQGFLLGRPEPAARLLGERSRPENESQN